MPLILQCAENSVDAVSHRVLRGKENSYLTRRDSASTDFDEYFMTMALREAEKAAAEGEVPLGCVVVAPAVLEPAHDGHDAIYEWDPSTAKILGRSHNMTEGLKDATAHAEMLAMSSAFAAVGDWRLTGTRLYVTKEPCPMCAGAIVLARPDAVIWGVGDPKRGGATVFDIFNHPGMNHHPEVVAGVLEDPCKAVLTEFFKQRRNVDAVSHRVTHVDAVSHRVNADGSCPFSDAERHRVYDDAERHRVYDDAERLRVYDDAERLRVYDDAERLRVYGRNER